MDAIANFVRGVLPEDNLAPASHYEVQKIVAGLGLRYQVINVCIDNCMIDIPWILPILAMIYKYLEYIYFLESF